MSSNHLFTVVRAVRSYKKLGRGPTYASFYSKESDAAEHSLFQHACDPVQEMINNFRLPVPGCHLSQIEYRKVRLP